MRWIVSGFLHDCDIIQGVGYDKRCLAGLSLEDASQLLAAVERVLEGLERVTLQAVFLEWMDRLSKCIATNGEHTE
jgi:hypothetical protein